jgi:hypothetical protein
MSSQIPSRSKPQKRPAKRAVELCSQCGEMMRLKDEDKIEYDYSIPYKFTGVCSRCADGFRKGL